MHKVINFFCLFYFYLFFFFEILIQVGLVVIPDSTAGSVLCAINKLLDQACILSENLHKFLASCCYSLLYFLLTLDKEDAEHVQKR